MNLSQSSPDNQTLSRDYFLRLGAVLAILAIVWFGQNFFGETKKEPPRTQSLPKENFAPPNPNNTTEAFAASLPLAQNAFLTPQSEVFKPIRNWGIKEPELSARSIYAIDATSGKILLQKDSEKQRPIASLSKLVTALVILEKASLKDEILISQSAVETLGDAGGLAPGQNLSVESLLYAMLLESSNDAAQALAESTSGGNGQFVNFMNQKVKKLGLKNTSFSDPSGLNPQNLSTAEDLAKIAAEVIKYPFLNYVTTTKEAEIASPDGNYKHRLKNINTLLEKYPEIIAGKTGYTDEAGGCMIVVIKSPAGGAVINIILGSQDRIADMDKLVEWEKEAFIW